MNAYKYLVAGCAPADYPTETHFGLLTLADNTICDIPQQIPFASEWGQQHIDSVPLRETQPLPKNIEIAWLSIVEKRFYYLSLNIAPDELEHLYQHLVEVSSQTEETYARLTVGMAPYGGTALWLRHGHKQILLGWQPATEIAIPMEDFLPERPEMTLDEYCASFGVSETELPPPHLFDKYMQQFTYRYVVRFGHWDEKEETWTPYDAGEIAPQFDHIEEMLFDGTYDKLHDGGLMKYHTAGKPKKLAVRWHVKKSDYAAYLWFDDEELCNTFERFYGAHRDTKADLLIRIDPEHNHYELSLFRYGMPRPQIISASCYQLIVFKSSLERYRSSNYRKESGAWLW